jgi:hypothetical protein
MTLQTSAISAGRRCTGPCSRNVSVVSKRYSGELVFPVQAAERVEPKTVKLTGTFKSIGRTGTRINHEVSALQMR